jgi:hypothetical protein
LGAGSSSSPTLRKSFTTEYTEKSTEGTEDVPDHERIVGQQHTVQSRRQSHMNSTGVQLNQNMF